MEITYTLIEDYLVLDIILSEPATETILPLGKYGQIHKSICESSVRFCITNLYYRRGCTRYAVKSTKQQSIG